MAKLILETFTKPIASFRQRIQLDGVEYSMAMEWNARDKAYYCTFEQGGEITLAGIRLVRGIDLLAQFRGRAGVPPGKIYLYDIENDTQSGAVTPETFGERFLLIYEEANGI